MGKKKEIRPDSEREFFSSGENKEIGWRLDSNNTVINSKIVERHGGDKKNRKWLFEADLEHKNKW